MKEIIKQVIVDEEKPSVELEIELLIEDCYEIVDAMYVYKELTNISGAGNRLLFARYFSLVESSIVYRIIMGIAKLFDSHADCRSIKKLINVLRQEKTQDK